MKNLVIIVVAIALVLIGSCFLLLWPEKSTANGHQPKVEVYIYPPLCSSKASRDDYDDYKNPITIKELPPGFSGWILFRDMHADRQGRLWLNGDGPLSSIQKGSFQLLVTRAGNDYVVDITTCYQRAWTLDDAVDKLSTKVPVSDLSVPHNSLVSDGKIHALLPRDFQRKSVSELKESDRGWRTDCSSVYVDKDGKLWLDCQSTCLRSEGTVSVTKTAHGYKLQIAEGHKESFVWCFHHGSAADIEKLHLQPVTDFLIGGRVADKDQSGQALLPRELGIRVSR